MIQRKFSRFGEAEARGLSYSQRGSTEDCAVALEKVVRFAGEKFVLSSRGQVEVLEGQRDNFLSSRRQNDFIRDWLKAKRHRDCAEVDTEASGGRVFCR